MRHLLVVLALLQGGAAGRHQPEEELGPRLPRPALCSLVDAPAVAVPFHGPHQAGITTPVQGHLHFASFDVITRNRTALARMLRRWTAAAAQTTTGGQVGEGARRATARPTGRHR